MKQFTKNISLLLSKLLFIIFIIFIKNYLFYKNDINKSTIICICTLGKKENNYIREYVAHYEKYAVDKIFLYDNNDIDGEKFEDVIEDYINKGFVEILNRRGVNEDIHKIMLDCYNKNYKKYDWLIYYELDEFINLHNYSSIKKFLEEKKFNNCQLIYLNLVCHTDNNLLYYENKSLAERFPYIVSPSKNLRLQVKFIIKGHIKKIKIKFLHLHYGTKKLINCNGFGHKNKINKAFTTEPDYNYYYIDHYYTKSTEEFINKITRGDLYDNSKEHMLGKIKKYFLYNNCTKKKVEMIEKKTGLNLSNYKKIGITSN